MNKRFKELDSLRGIAAIMVITVHFLSLVPEFGKKVMYSSYGNIFSVIWNGHSAVIMFFVLSGFVLSLSIYSKKDFNYSDYVLMRICRIYIPYITIVLTAIGLKALLDSKVGTSNGLVNWALWDIKTTLSSVMSHLLFLGEYDATSFVMVIWSLVHEMRISLIFPFVVIMLFKVNWKISLITAICLSSISFMLMKVIPTEFNTPVSTNYFITLHYTSLFIVGALLAKHREYLINKIRSYKAVNYLLFPMGFLFFNYPRIPFSVPSKLIGEVDFTLYQIAIDWFIAFGATIIVLLALSSSLFSKLLLMKPVHYMGEISYSLYLVHPVVLISTANALYGVVSIPMLLTISLVLTLFFSALSHKFIEKPSVQLGRIIIKSRKGVLSNKIIQLVPSAIQLKMKKKLM